MKKRLLSTLLALCMTLSLLPTNAMATEMADLGESIVEDTAVENEQTVPEAGSAGDPEAWDESESGNSTSVEGEALPELPVELNSSERIAYPVEGGNLYFDPTTGTITDCDTSVTSAVIPSSIDGTVITSIGNNAFRSCSSLANITIPSGVTSIGEYAFLYCRGLTDVTIPNNVTSIARWAFEDCSGLMSVTISDSVANIRENAFRGCSGLTDLTIPGNARVMPGAFSGCTAISHVKVIGSGDMDTLFYNVFESAKNSLITVDIENGITGIRGFSNCSRLTSVTIPNSVTTIGGFDGCSNLTSINIPDNVTRIGANAFSGCSSLTSVNIPDGITSIEYGVFSGCSNLTSVNIPDNVTSIERFAFSNCIGLTAVTIPNNVTKIAGDAFEGCSGLTNVTISVNTTYIGVNAFYGCTDVSYVKVTGTGAVTPTIKECWEASGSHTLAVDLEDGITDIASGVFSGCSNLTDITIPDSVTSIGSSAFSGCTGLTSVTIPSSVASIGSSTFNNCISLTDVYYGGTQEQWTALCSGLLPSNVVIHYNSTGPGLTQDELKEKYIQEHIDYYKSSYTNDILPMESVVGLDFMLDDAKSSFSEAIYKEIYVSQGYISDMLSFFDLKSYVDIDWVNGAKLSLKLPDVATKDFGSSEYSTILYQLIASDMVYNGILETFSMNYENNVKSFAKAIADKTIDIGKDINEDDLKAAKDNLMKAAETIKTADPQSEEYRTAYENFESLGREFLDPNKTKAYLKEVASVASDSFSFLGTVLGEINSVGKAYQYVCWAESYAQTDKTFVEVLNAIASKADEEVRLLNIKHLSSPTNPDYDPANPYSEVSMCLGLSKSIKTYIETMTKYAADVHQEFKNSVIDSTGDSCVDLVIGFLTSKIGGASICPELAAINGVLSTGKLLIDAFTDVDSEYKMALTVKSLQFISKFLEQISNEYGGAISSIYFPPTFTETEKLETRFAYAVRFHETIKIYKNAMLLACEYATEYERSKLVHNSKLTNSVPNWWYDSGATTPWQKQASRSSSAIACIAFQKARISDIHCHEDGLNYDSSTGLVQYGKSSKIVTVACPVEVTVKAPDGKQIAYLSDHSVIVVSGYEPYFFTVPADDEYIKVVLIPDEENYDISIQGTDSGNMNVFVGRYKENMISEVETFANYPVTAETTGCLDSGDKNNTLGYLTLGSNDDKDGYAVSFYANGGTVNPAFLTTENSKKISNLPIPTRESYIFEGWFTDAENGERVSEDKIYTEDTTLYAHWTREKPFAVSLESSDTSTEITFAIPEGLSEDSMQVIAARYESGRMTQVVFGNGLPGEGPVTFPAKIEWNQGWKIFFLSSEDRKPLCKPTILAQ